LLVQTIDRGAARRRTILGLVVATAATLAAPTLANAATSGYVWADQPTASVYVPSTFYQANSKGKLNIIYRTGVGQYQVVFPGLANDRNGGTVNVTAYGPRARTYCGVVDWGRSGRKDIAVDVRCADSSGALVDSYFDASYSVPAKKGGSLAYVWANQPSAASYTPEPFYQFNSKGGLNTITRGAPGVYTIRLPKLGAANGTVKVTTYGPVSTRCKVVYWFPDGADQTVTVECRNSAGAYVDSMFTMTFAHQRSLLGTGDYGYAWASSPNSAPYNPFPVYSQTSPSGPIVIVRYGPGLYGVRFQGVGQAILGHVQVTAYGDDANECRVEGWGGDGAVGQEVGVECYDTNDTPMDTLFTIQWMR
jgi:hypothetical protein